MGGRGKETSGISVTGIFVVDAEGDGGGGDVVVDRRKSGFCGPEDEHARGKRGEKAGSPPPPSSRRKAGAIKEPAGPSLGIKHLRHEGT